MKNMTSSQYRNTVSPGGTLIVGNSQNTSRTNALYKSGYRQQNTASASQTVNARYVGELEKNLGELRVENGNLIQTVANLETKVHQLDTQNEHLNTEINIVRNQASEV